MLMPLYAKFKKSIVIPASAKLLTKSSSQAVVPNILLVKVTNVYNSNQADTVPKKKPDSLSGLEVIKLKHLIGWI